MNFIQFKTEEEWAKTPRNNLQKIQDVDAVLKVAVSGEKTLQQIGEMFGVSRERVRQIVKAKLGENFHHYRDNQNKKRKLRNLQKIEAKRQFNARTNFNCGFCAAPVTYGQRGKKYCVEHRVLALRRAILHPRICLTCGITFFPLRNFKYNTTAKGLYHSRQCWTKSEAFRKGITGRRKPKFTDEQLLDFLRDYKKTTGKVPKYWGWRLKSTSPCPTTSGTIASRFGTWTNALKLAGVNDEENTN